MPNQDPRPGHGSAPPPPSLATPSFIIKVGAVYYVTTGVWEYDPGKAGLTAAEQAGVTTIADAFASGQPKLEAVKQPAGHVSSLCATNPPTSA